MKANLVRIADDVRVIRLLLEDGDETEMKRKKRKKKTTGLPPEVWAEHERTQKMLAERIAYHEARIAARERGENLDAATA